MDCHRPLPPAPAPSCPALRVAGLGLSLELVLELGLGLSRISLQKVLGLLLCCELSLLVGCSFLVEYIGVCFFEATSLFANFEIVTN